MSAVALLLREEGWEISGSDEGFYPPVSEYLERAGIAFAHGYRKENIPADADLIVIGKNAKLVPESNEEVAAAFASGKPVKSFPDVLEELTAKTDNIVVAGSYGKSTCTALLSWTLKTAGKDPSYFIGEIVRGLDAHAHKGDGGTFVLEGDEYPSANWDARSKFLHYNPRSILLTSATHDHVNVYPTHEEYLKPFRELLALLPPQGLLVVNGAEDSAHTLARGYRGTTAVYGTPEGWHAKRVAYGMPTTFDLMRGNEKVASLSTLLLGAHNVENIVGVSALLLEKQLLTPEELAAGVATFEGVKRRMELLAPRSRIPVFEGFGSSYEKAKSAIAAMKLHFPAKRLVVIFEPHTFTWRSRAALPQYDDVFNGAAEVVVYYPEHNDGKKAELTLEEIAERVKGSGIEAYGFADAKTLQDEFVSTATEEEAVLLLTSGDLGGLIKSLPAALQERFPV